MRGGLVPVTAHSEGTSIKDVPTREHLFLAAVEATTLVPTVRVVVDLPVIHQVAEDLVEDLTTANPATIEGNEGEIWPAVALGTIVGVEVKGALISAEVNWTEDDGSLAAKEAEIAAALAGLEEG